MTSRGSVARLAAVVSTGACGGVSAWVQWWPHSDNRQNLAIVTVGLLIATSVVAWRVVLSTKPRFREIVGVVAVIVLLGAMMFATLALSTAEVCGDCPPF